MSTTTPAGTFSADAKQSEWDSAAWRTKRDQNLLAWLNGSQAAVDCAVALSAISETWDDLVDRDRRVSTAEINQAFVNCLVSLELNPFYTAHRHLLLPVVWMGINAWMDANALEEAPNKHSRCLSFYLRNYCYEVVSMCALCVGGFEHLRSISLEMRLFFQHESYFTWEKQI